MQRRINVARSSDTWHCSCLTNREEDLFIAPKMKMFLLPAKGEDNRVSRFRGKCVFVTGAGSGIGREIAIAFAREGANLILNDLPSQLRIGSVKEEIEAMGGSCQFKLGDVSSADEVRSMFEGLDRIDVLVNNAGYLRESPILEMTDADWDRMIKVHLYGTFYCAREAVRVMLKQGEGRIINISSDLGQLGCEKLVHYSAAKGGIIAFTKSLARELGTSGILVNSIAPGGTVTPLVEALGPEYVQEESARYPLKRLGLPAEIASVALFLASKDSSFMTGQVLGVNGGGVMYG